MKKSLIFFLILAIFSAVIYFIGCVSFKVEVGEFGVLVSKTSGIDEKPIMNGDRDWRWEFLLPTNTKIEKFKIEPVNVTKTVSGELPSGSLYTALFNATGSFNYKFNFSLSLSVTPENVIQLLKENTISNNEDLNKYLSMAADSIAQLATSYFLTKAYDNPSFRPESVRRSDIMRKIRLEEDFPYVDLTVFALTECIIPDYSLYKKLQNQGILVVQDFKADIRQIPPTSSSEEKYNLVDSKSKENNTTTNSTSNDNKNKSKDKK